MTFTLTIKVLRMAFTLTVKILRMAFTLTVKKLRMTFTLTVKILEGSVPLMTEMFRLPSEMTEETANTGKVLVHLFLCHRLPRWPSG